MSLGRVRKGVSRLYREMFVREMGPFFMTPLACPSATPQYAFNPSLSAENIHESLHNHNISPGRPFLSLYKKRKSWFCMSKTWICLSWHCQNIQQQLQSLQRGRHVQLQPLALVCVIPEGLALKANLIRRDMISHPIHLLQGAADPRRRAQAWFPETLSISAVAGMAVAAPGTKNNMRKSQLSHYPPG